MREIRLIGKRTVALGLAFAANAVFGAAYYVDSLDGDDGADGSSPESAWESLARASERDFHPGDRLLLRSGRAWSGSLILKGSGTRDSPILLSRYGVGSRPKIEAGGKESLRYLRHQGIGQCGLQFQHARNPLAIQ